MADQPEPVPPLAAGPPPPGPPPNPWPGAVMWMVIVLILVTAAVYVFKSCRDLPVELVDRTSKALGNAGQSLADVASAFRRGNISTSFVSYATTVSNHQYLQFATLKQMEIFTRSESTSTAFGYVPLPEVVVEARAPVEYTYFLDLNAEWRFVLESNVVHVFAPPIRANRPSIDVSAMTYEVRKGAFNFKRAEVQQNLKKTITGLVVVRARENIPLIQEPGRKQTQEFVERWLTRSFADGSQYHVKVWFPGENTNAPVRFGPEKLP